MSGSGQKPPSKSRNAYWTGTGRLLVRYRETEMLGNAPKKVKLVREVLWRSPNGKWCVVEGPFPNHFPRTETRDDVVRASKLLVDGVVARPGTSKAGVYAKVLVGDIQETGGKNEFGPITP